jgi:hypothetical protein
MKRITAAPMIIFFKEERRLGIIGYLKMKVIQEVNNERIGV